MKKVILGFFIFFCCSSGLAAQETLTAISAPTSPASALLGVEPQSVLSPKSYRALETALYSNFLNNSGDGLVPNDFALEFTPYWAKDHSLTIEEYLYPEDIWEGQIVRNSSFSLATTQNFILGDSSATNGLSFGYRTTLYFGNQQDRERVSQFKKQISRSQGVQSSIGAQAFSLVETVQSKSDFISNIRAVIKKNILEVYPVSEDEAEEQTDIILVGADTLTFDADDRGSFVENFMNVVDERLKDQESELNAREIFDKFENYIKNRQGFSLDIAFGLFLNFPGNSFSSAAAPHQSIWVTPSYRFKDELNRLKVTGVFRYEGYNTSYYKEYFSNSKVFENNIDYGVAVSGEFDRFSLKFEAVGRSSNSLVPAGVDTDGNELFRKDSRSDFQAIGTFLYRLNDKIALTYSLGERFNPIVSPGNTLVSLLSMNVGFGGPTRKDLSD